MSSAIDVANAKRGRARHALEAERCRRDAHFFIFGSRLLHTKDEHDLTDPVKPVPDLPYLRVLLDCYLVGAKLISPEDAGHARRAGIELQWLLMLRQIGTLFVEKSRDVFVTNLTCCYLLWRARAKEHQVILVQSKKEEDAAPLVFNKEPQFGRMSFMEDHLPRHLKMCAWPKAGAYGHLYFPNGSHVRAIPEGGHIIRSEHPSVIFSDEAAFQPEFGSSYTAALPAVEGGGQFIAVSSAEPGEFAQLVEPDQARTPTDIPGLSYTIAGGATPVLRVHYSADPDQRPGTPAGDRWRERAAGRYPGGLASARWLKEMEIDYAALGGSKLMPDWETWKTAGHIVVAPFVPTGYRLYGSYDHGWNNPAAFHVHGVNGDGHKITLYEFYADRVPVSSIAKLIKGQTIRIGRPNATIDPARVIFDGNPFAGQLAWIVADPSIWSEDQPMKDEPNKSIADLFRREGVVMIPGERGGDLMVAEWLLGTFWADPLAPTYRITTDCPRLIWELGEQRFKQHSAHLGLTRNEPEALVDKHNHAWDSLKMFLQRFPPSAASVKPASAMPGSFQWWRRVAKDAAKGKPIGTFKRAMVS